MKHIWLQRAFSVTEKASAGFWGNKKLSQIKHETVFVISLLIRSVLVFLTGDSEDDLAGIYHVKLCSCDALDICVILTELFLRPDLLEFLG